MSSGHVSGGQIARLGQRADVDVDRLDRAEFAAPALVDHLAVVLEHALAAAGDHAAVAARGFDHQRAFAQGAWFPASGSTRPCRRGRPRSRSDGVPVVRSGDVHGIDVLAGQQFAEVVVGGAVLVLVVLVHLVSWRSSRTSLRTSHTATYCTSLLPRKLPMSPPPWLPRPMPPMTMRSLGGGGLGVAEGGGRDDGGEPDGGGRQTGRFQEVAASGSW